MVRDEVMGPPTPLTDLGYRARGTSEELEQGDSGRVAESSKRLGIVEG
jgi:hypothetical protein